MSAEPADGPPSQTAKRNSTPRKRAANADGEEVPQKATRLRGLKEIPASHVILTRTCVGSGSYGSCHHSTFRTADEGKGENQHQAENTVRQELIYKACIINKLSYHPRLSLLFGVCSEEPPFRLILQFHIDKMTHSSLTISSALSKCTMGISKITNTRYLLNQKVHLSTSSEVTEHCFVYSLSDCGDPGLQQQCDHSHGKVCLQCENLKEVLEVTATAVEKTVKSKPIVMHVENKRRVS